MPSISFLPQASDEYDQAYAWYATRSRQAARDFAAEISQALDTIAQAPLSSPLDVKGCRRFVLQQFPYSVIYLVTNGDVLIVAIAHSSRRPHYWRRRLP
jgi:plasmid stabilization system protein ParE